MSHGLVIRPIAGTDRKAVGMRLEGEFPLSLSGYAFDVVSNLRAALDHVGYASAVALGANNPRNTAFPFADTKKELLKDRRLQKKREDIPPRIQRVILAFKPWRRGNQYLWGLNKLRNEKLHKLISQPRIAIATLPVEIPDGWEWGARNGKPYWDPKRNELIAFTAPLEFVGPGPQMDFQFQVALGGDNPLTGQPILPALHRIGFEVENVIKAVEAEVTRLLGLRAP